MNTKEYKARFSEPPLRQTKNCDPKEVDTRAGRALAYALDIRKFEIELYWKRATYFWAFIAASFAGYGLIYKTAIDHEPWLALLFASLGLVFSFTWYLVNRGSKFWQSNWERHVDLLEDMTLGPLYKVVAVTEDPASGNPLISPAQFSVSKLNQILSVFVTTVWLMLFIKSLLPISATLPIDIFKVIDTTITIGFIFILWHKGKSTTQFKKKGLHERGKDDGDMMEEIFAKHVQEVNQKSEEHRNKVLESQEYKQGIQYLDGISDDFILATQLISIYSTRAKDIYANFLGIHIIDEITESLVAINKLAKLGTYNQIKRELRYLIELTTKCVVVDYEMMGRSMEDKLAHLYDNIPNSSIDPIDRCPPIFKPALDMAFKAEVKDFFYKACAYIHPSKTQIEERIKNYSKGNTIGFDTAKMLTNCNTLTFRALDIILVLIFHSFGQSMSGDLFINGFDKNPKWKFHKGKYTKEYSALFDYKHERQHPQNP